jgi:hypothetical protein
MKSCRTGATPSTEERKDPHARGRGSATACRPAGSTAASSEPIPPPIGERAADELTTDAGVVLGRAFTQLLANGPVNGRTPIYVTGLELHPHATRKGRLVVLVDFTRGRQYESVMFDLADAWGKTLRDRLLRIYPL